MNCNINCKMKEGFTFGPCMLFAVVVPTLSPISISLFDLSERARQKMHRELKAKETEH